MSEKQTRILRLIQNNNKISANKLAIELKVTSRTIERELKFLKDSGRIVRIGGARGGHWELL